ncbi:membrane-spanning 4-domains subfamily A member 4A-like [Nannospalax galili]|uniref:membrane-spanning 4-domains subfamily A member 4A-like n=1 Tax=Nannospalax galili TaxID=1026970 RepID=UPI00111BF277|nr:membrane-spanning 4-domains subfamily A member 4A-like [Nannospalax galili]
MNVPMSENVLQPGQLNGLVLPFQQQKTLLIFLKGQPQVLGVAQILIGLTTLCLAVMVTLITQDLFDNLILIKIGYHPWESFSGILVGLAMLSGLEASIALSLSLFGCRAACSINKASVWASG